jgi:hypothetical protein
LGHCDLCSKVKIRCEIADHKEKECPEAKIHCAFCNLPMRRKNEKNHSRDECMLTIIANKDKEILILNEKLEKMNNLSINMENEIKFDK